MSPNNRAKLEKQKRRERKFRKERNLRRNQPQAAQSDDEDFDFDTALEGLPTVLHIERVMRRLARATGTRRFENGSEVMAAIEDLDRPGAEAAAAEFNREDPLETAQDYAFVALDPKNTDFAVEFARAALELDPECIDALALLGLLEGESAERRIVALEGIVATGHRALGGPDFFEQNRGSFWTDVLTRPYMRARRMLAVSVHGVKPLENKGYSMTAGPFRLPNGPSANFEPSDSSVFSGS